MQLADATVQALRTACEALRPTAEVLEASLHDSYVDRTDRSERRMLKAYDALRDLLDNQYGRRNSTA